MGKHDFRLRGIKRMLFKNISTFLEVSGIITQYVFQNIQVTKWGDSWKYESTSKSNQVVTVPKTVEGYTWTEPEQSDQEEQAKNSEIILKLWIHKERREMDGNLGTMKERLVFKESNLKSSFKQNEQRGISDKVNTRPD